jgi:hypothetical protein
MWETFIGLELPAAPALPDPLALFLLTSLVLAARFEAPFRTWRLRKVLPEAVARALAVLPFGPPQLDGGSGRRELHNDSRRYFAGEVLERHPVTRRVAEAFQSPDVAAGIARATGAALDGAFVRIEYAADPDGFWLEPHTDLGVKALSLLIQLGEAGQEDLGTDLYAGPGAWRERAAFGWNTGLMFVPSGDSWHGFEPRPIRGLRRSVIVNYVTREWRAREQLAFPERPVRLAARVEPIAHAGV